MKRLLSISVLVLCAIGISRAQNNEAKADDLGRIVLTSYLDEGKTVIPKSAYRLLKNKLTQISTQNGMGGSIPQRFIITANVNVLSKDITQTAPPMNALTIETTFYIGDGIDGTLFSTASTISKGVGESEDKAFIAALKAIKPSSSEFSQFIDTGKRKIIEYYNANGDIYITKAQTLAKEERFDDAIYMLMCIPEVCKDVYTKAMNEASAVFTAMINFESAKYLTEAKAIWASGMDYDSAEKAAKLLAKIHPDASCYNSAVSLSQEIASRVKELDAREWQYKMDEQKNEHDQQMAQINAAKEIALASAKNQPKIVYNVYWW